MLIRRLVGAVVALAAAVVLAGCSSSTVSAPSMPPAQRADVAAYFAAHPTTSTMVPQGWHRGVLVASSKSSHACLGDCSTWSGTVIAPDGSNVALSSSEGHDEVYDAVPVGSDFIWQNGPDSASDVKVLKYNAVSATPPSPAAPSSPSTAPATPTPAKSTH